VPDEEFAAAVSGTLADPVKHEAMREAARAHARTASWDSVFEGVYAAYETILLPKVRVGQARENPAKRVPVAKAAMRRK
jgi:hypothetical protein